MSRIITYDPVDKIFYRGDITSAARLAKFDKNDNLVYFDQQNNVEVTHCTITASEDRFVKILSNVILTSKKNALLNNIDIISCNQSSCDYAPTTLDCLQNQNDGKIETILFDSADAKTITIKDNINLAKRLDVAITNNVLDFLKQNKNLNTKMGDGNMLLDRIITYGFRDKSHKAAPDSLLLNTVTNMRIKHVFHQQQRVLDELTPVTDWNAETSSIYVYEKANLILCEYPTVIGITDNRLFIRRKILPKIANPLQITKITGIL